MMRSPCRGLPRRAALPLLLGVLFLLQTACGQLTIRTWVNIDEDASMGEVALVADPPPPPVPLDVLQGGFLTKIVVDTRDIPAPLSGPLTIEDLRIGGHGGGFVGDFCVWNDPNLGSGGDVTFDLLGGSASATIQLNALAQATLGAALNLPPTPVQQELALDLGGGLGLDSLLGGLENGTIAGSIAAETSLSQQASIGGLLDVIFNLDMSVVNQDGPPLFDAGILSFCQTFFDQQGADLFYYVNSKASYLRADIGDHPVLPQPIPLAEIGAAPGDTLRITRVGTYASNESSLRDGSQTAATGVFSASDVVLSDLDQRYRVPDAIDAGSDVTTVSYQACWLLCPIIRTDIPEDFNIPSSVDVVVPAGAQYLIVAPHDVKDEEWESNSGLSFGVTLEVNP